MYEKLFTPIRIKGLELKNRVILPAMGTKFAGKASYVTQQLIDYHVARGKRRMRIEYRRGMFRAYAKRAERIPFHK